MARARRRGLWGVVLLRSAGNRLVKGWFLDRGITRLRTSSLCLEVRRIGSNVVYSGKALNGRAQSAFQLEDAGLKVVEQDSGVAELASDGGNLSVKLLPLLLCASLASHIAGRDLAGHQPGAATGTEGVGSRVYPLAMWACNFTHRGPLNNTGIPG